MLIVMQRRTLLVGAAAWSAGANAPGARAAPLADALHFPADFGAHPSTRTEWWYATGSVQGDGAQWGFQITFFRSATGLASEPPTRFDPAQLVWAHAALTDLAHGRLRHDQRMARAGFGIAQAQQGDTDVRLRDWQLQRVPAAGNAARSRYASRVASAAGGFAWTLQFDATQPVLLQGQGGVSRKGPDVADVSRYYSEPQLAVQGELTVDGRPQAVRGRAWLDHEWSDAFVPSGAVGWDWVGMNLDQGGALTAFRLRRADGTSLYAGGSYRAPGAATWDFAPQEVAFMPQRAWKSPLTQTSYPVQWTLQTPQGRYTVRALLDAQELDTRTGPVYWEGLSELLDASQHRVGLGYLEMTGYAAELRL